MTTERHYMNDFNIDITITVYRDNQPNIVFNSNTLSDETIHLMMNDIELKLDNITGELHHVFNYK